MKKIGIVTIVDGANYGNRLQNYALQELIKSLGYETETLLRYSSNDLDLIQKAKILIKDLAKILCLKKNTHFNQKKRFKKFEDFNRRYIIFSTDNLGFNRYPDKIAEKYMYFVCGSDQVWNANFSFIKEDLQNYLASFALPRQRVAYAASFGTDSISSEFQDTFRNELPQFKALGIREISGVRLANVLGSRDDATLVLDPTLMLSKEEWMRCANKPKYLNDEKLVVTYFLDGRTENTNNYISKIAGLYNARIVNLESDRLTDNLIGSLDDYSCSPDEFVWLIEHAECVLTDSYHASIFSIIFNRPFIVFQRKQDGNDMSSRTDTLLELFDLQECKDNIDNPSKSPSVYDDVTGKIELERQKSLSFIRSALGT